MHWGLKPTHNTKQKCGDDMRGYDMREAQMRPGEGIRVGIYSGDTGVEGQSTRVIERVQLTPFLQEPNTTEQT